MSGFDELLANISDPFVVVGRDGDGRARIVYANPTAIRATDGGAERVVGVPIDEVLAGQEEPLRALEEAFATRRPVRVRYLHRNVAGPGTTDVDAAFIPMGDRVVILPAFDWWRATETELERASRIAGDMRALLDGADQALRALGPELDSAPPDVRDALRTARLAFAYVEELVERIGAVSGKPHDR